MLASRVTLLGRVSKLKLNTGKDVKEFQVPDMGLAHATLDDWDSYGYH